MMMQVGVWWWGGVGGGVGSSLRVKSSLVSWSGLVAQLPPAGKHMLPTTGRPLSPGNTPDSSRCLRAPPPQAYPDVYVASVCLEANYNQVGLQTVQECDEIN